MITSTLIALFILSFIVFFHELGHFLSAIYFKIPVEEFTIGMGPKLFDLKGKLSTYSLRILPLGGYVKIKEIDLMGENIHKKKRTYEKFIVTISGVLMNFSLFFLIVLVNNLVNGYINLNSTVVNKTQNGSILKVGDRVLSIEDIKINSWKEFIVLLPKNKNSEIKIKIQRDNREKIIEVKNLQDINNLLRLAYPWKISIPGSIYASFISMKDGIIGNLNTIKKIATRDIKTEQLSGPIGIINQIKNNTDDIWKLVLMTAYISLSLGMFNLLPLPSLDGGRIVFILLEFLGIKINQKIEDIIHIFGFIILILLTIIIGKNDIMKIRR